VPLEWGRCSGKAGGETGDETVSGAVTCSFRGTPVTLGVRVCPLNSVRLFRTRRTTLNRVFVLSLRPVVTIGQSYEREFRSVNRKESLALLLSPYENGRKAGETTRHGVTRRASMPARLREAVVVGSRSHCHSTAT
jgi:hypothetical protein